MTSKILRALESSLTIFALSILVIAPLSPSIAQLTFHRDRCYPPTAPELKVSAVECLIESASMAPLVLIFGGVALDEDPRPQMWRESSEVTAILSIFTTLVYLLWRRKRGAAW